MHRYVITWTETRTCTAEIESEKDPLEDEQEAIKEGYKAAYKEEDFHEEVEHCQILSSEKVNVPVGRELHLLLAGHQVEAVGVARFGAVA